MRKISIVTINLNNVAGLRKTAQSIVRQSLFSEIEWIVIDGGSTDGSLDVIHEYKSKMAYWVSEPDSGIYNAMNKGVVQAHGEYVLFLNSGDRLHSNDVIEQFVSNELYGLYDYLVGRVVTVLNDVVKGEIIPKSQVTCKDLLSTDFYLSHPAEFIRRERFMLLKYDESYRISADMKFVAEDMIRNGAMYAALPIIVSDYDLSGISSTNTDLTKLERIRMQNDVLPPLFLPDYIQMLNGDTILTKIIIKINKNRVAYVLLTFFAGIIFTPIWLSRVTSVIIRRILR